MRQKDFVKKIEEYLENSNIKKIGLIHCHDIITYIAAQRLKRKFKCKLIYDCHEIYHGTPRVSIVKRFSFYFLNFLIKKNADLIITINDDFKKYYSKFFSQEIKVVYNSPYYLKKNKTNKLKESSPLNNYKISKDSRILLYQGGMQDYRGIDYIISEAKFLNDDWQVIFMGHGSKANYYKKEINKKFKLSRKVQFIDSVPLSELDKFSSGADIGLVIFEPVGLNHKFCTPNKMFEYPRSNLPVISGPTPTLANFVKKYDYGWSVNMNKYELSNLVNKITNDEIKKKALNGEKFIRDFDGKKYIPVLEEIYKRYV